MGVFTRIVLVGTLCLGGFGCGKDPKPERKPQVFVPKNPHRKIKAIAPSPFDKEGKLKPSDRALAGLQLPMGLTSVYKRERKEVFKVETRISFEKLVEYFGPRLFTGKVNVADHEVHYVRAVPNNKLDALIQLDVRISKRIGHTKLEIVQFPKNFAKAPTPARAKELLKKQFETLE